MHLGMVHAGLQHQLRPRHSCCYVLPGDMETLMGEGWGNRPSAGWGVDRLEGGKSQVRELALRKKMSSPLRTTALKW